MERRQVWSWMVAAALAGGARADVLIVDASGAGDFLQVQAAIDAAADGDTVLVRSGAYAGFTVAALDLDVVADIGADARVLGRVRVFDIGPEQEVVLVGLSIQAQNTGQDALLDALVLDASLGAVRVEGCLLRGAQGADYSLTERGGDALVARDAEDVSLVRCQLRGGSGAMSFTGFSSNRGGDGLNALRSTIALHDSLSYGGDGGPGDFLGCDLAGAAGHGGRFIDSSVYASGARFVGGDGGGDDLFGCFDGGHGLYLIGAQTQGALLDTWLQGGLGACGAPAGQPLRAEGGASATSFPGDARLFRAPNPVREADQVELVFQGAPGDEVFLNVGAGFGQLLLPTLEGVLLLELPLLQARRFMGVVPVGGTLTKALVIPSLPPAQEAGLLRLQSLFVSSGGDARLGSPATLVRLDQAF